MSAPLDQLLGLAIERVDGVQCTYRVFDVRSPEIQHAKGTYPYCCRKRLEVLETRYRDRPQNVRSPTLGGKQLWADVFHHTQWRIQQSLSGSHFRLLDRSDVRRAWGTYDECRVAFERCRLDLDLHPRSDHAVVLLHGLIRAKDSMRSLGRAINEAGYEVMAINYPSTRGQIEDFAAQVSLVLNRTIGVNKVSFVTHSLGGIILRAMLSETDQGWRDRIAVQRAVMVFPPNQGAARADKWRDHPLARAVMGPVLGELGQSDPPPWPAPDCPFAIIAGSRDKTVSLSEAWLPEAAEVQLLDVEHTFGMGDHTLVEGVLQYINTGSFQ